MNLKINYKNNVKVVNNNLLLARISLNLPSPKVKYQLPKLPIIEKEEIKEKVEEIINIEEIIKEDKITEEQKLVALTFDDGPSKYTKEILEVLDQNGCKATFFISGSNIIGNEDRIKEIQKYGNQIGIHGYSHIPFTDLDIDDINIEIATTSSMLFDIGINASSLVRPPFGKLNETIKNNVRTPLILWNIDPEDWKNQDKDYIKDVIKNNISAGSIIALHDRYEWTLEALKEVIPELIKQGYKFTTIDEMHKRYDVRFVPGRVYAKVKNN